MKDFRKFLWASLAKYKIASIWRWAFTNSVMTKYIKEKFKLKIIIQGKLQYNVYFVKVSNPSLSNQLFLHKKEIKEHLNKKLEDIKLKKIEDIKFV